MAGYFRPRNPTPNRASRYYPEECDSDDDCDLAIFMAPVVAQSPVSGGHKSRRFQLPINSREHTPFRAPTRPRNPTPNRASRLNEDCANGGLSRPRNPTPTRARARRATKSTLVERSSTIRIGSFVPIANKTTVTVKKDRSTKPHPTTGFQSGSSSGVSSTCSSPTTSGIVQLAKTSAKCNEAVLIDAFRRQLVFA